VVRRLKKKIKFNTEETNELRAELKKNDEEIQKVRTQIVECEEYQRRQNLRIFGVQEFAKENTDSVAIKLDKEKLGVKIEQKDICRNHRIGPKSPGILTLRFTNYRARVAVFSSKKKLKGTNITPITHIREDLCNERLNLLRSATEKFSYKQVWSQEKSGCVKEWYKILSVYYDRPSSL